MDLKLKSNAAAKVINGLGWRKLLQLILWTLLLTQMFILF